MEQLEFEFMKDMPIGCLYRMIGQCKNCTPDYDRSHHPNNYDCPKFHALGVMNVRGLPELVEEEEYLRTHKNHKFNI